jgi:hypothetical protein
MTMATCPKCQQEIIESVSEPVATSFRRDGQSVTIWRKTIHRQCACGALVTTAEAEPPENANDQPDVS